MIVHNSYINIHFLQIKIELQQYTICKFKKKQHNMVFTLSVFSFILLIFVYKVWEHRQEIELQHHLRRVYIERSMRDRLHGSLEQRRTEAWVHIYLNSFGRVNRAAVHVYNFAFLAPLHHHLAPPRLLQSVGGGVWDGLSVQLLVRSAAFPRDNIYCLIHTGRFSTYQTGIHPDNLVQRHTLPKRIHSGMLPLHKLNVFKLQISMLLNETRLPRILRGAN